MPTNLRTSIKSKKKHHKYLTENITKTYQNANKSKSKNNRINFEVKKIRETK